jgi:enoyl-CoA hydratase
MAYQHLEIESQGPVATLWLNRPEKLNAMSADMWEDIPRAVAEIDNDASVRVMILAGRGPAFSVGIDVHLLAGLTPTGPSPATRSLAIYDSVRRLQLTMSCMAASPKPVIAAIHGYCLGAGMSLISAADVRLAAEDAVFSIRETKMGLVADVGALQRLPDIIGTADTAEMALTGDDYPSAWALQHGLISRVSRDHDVLIEEAHDLATRIAVNSPLVTTGVKRVLQATRGRTVEEGLEYVARWNSAHLLSNDLTEALTAFLEKRAPDFSGD